MPRFVAWSLVVIVVVSLGWQTGKDNDEAESTDKDSLAFMMCKDFVKQRLRSPATAKFRNFYEEDGEVSVTGFGNGPYTVSSTVDSQNGFGALIRSNFTCTVTNTGGDNWRLDDLDFVDGGG